MTKKLALVTVAAASALLAQNTIQGPVIGYVADASNQSLRAVSGIPGSSVLGDALPDMQVSKSAVASKSAIAVTGDERSARWIDLRNGNVAAISAPAGVDDVFVSPGGRAAILVYRDANRLAVAKGADDVRSVELSAELAQGSFSVSDDASVILAVKSSGEASVIDADGNRWTLNVEGAVRSAAFLEASRDALVATSKGAYLVRGVNADANARLIWEGDAAITQGSADQNKVLVMDVANQLFALQLDQNSSRRLECACEPSTLSRMSDAVFRLNEVGPGPLWLVDWNGVEPRAVFVPAEVKSEQ